MMRRTLLVAAVGLLVAAGAARAATPLSPQQRRELFDLRKAVLGSDPVAAKDALEGLKAMGEPAEGSLFGVVRELLTRDRTLIQQANRVAGDTARVAETQARIDEVRGLARENLKKLAKNETLQKAREYYDQLASLYETLRPIYDVRAATLDALARRPGLMEIYRKHAPPGDTLFSDEREAQLAEQGQAVLGMTPEAMASIPEFGEGKEPSDPAQRHLWHFRACRRIEAYNERLRDQISGEEWRNIELVNGYREYLGYLPYEVDPRLMQSARRHSKEMADLGYFSHDSPTPSEKSHTKRMANAGYKGGYSENIAAGSGSGEHTFWQWFSSPPHHLNMVNPGSVHLGVGNWNNLWTQNMGRAKRLMLGSDADRQAAAVKGDVLPPQGGGSGGGRLRTSPR